MFLVEIIVMYLCGITRKMVLFLRVWNTAVFYRVSNHFRSSHSHTILVFLPSSNKKKVLKIQLLLKYLHMYVNM